VRFITHALFFGGNISDAGFDFVGKPIDQGRSCFILYLILPCSLCMCVTENFSDPASGCGIKIINKEFKDES